jgi:hypothetical protein
MILICGAMMASGTGPLVFDPKALDHWLYVARTVAVIVLEFSVAYWCIRRAGK